MVSILESRGGDKVNKMNILFVVGLCVVCFGLGAVVSNVDFGVVHRDPRVNVFMSVTKFDGVNVEELASGNTITDIGETFLGESAITGEDANATWAIAVSNDGSASSAWTELPTEVTANGFGRAGAEESVAWSNGGDWAINFTYTFTATGSQTLQTAGLHWDDTGESDNNLFACADFTQTAFETDDTLTVTWVITCNAN